MKKNLLYGWVIVLSAAVMLFVNPIGAKAAGCDENNQDEYAYVIYSSAGECDLTKVNEVGILYVNYANGNVTAEFTSPENFGLDSEDFYVGSESLARYADGEFTIVPGDYPFDLGQAPDDSFSVVGAKGEIYVVAPAPGC